MERSQSDKGPGMPDERYASSTFATGGRETGSRLPDVERVTGAIGPSMCACAFCTRGAKDALRDLTLQRIAPTTGVQRYRQISWPASSVRSPAGRPPHL